MAREEKYSVEDVASIVFNEGIGYAIQCYLSEDDIDDPTLARLWKEARERLDQIDEYLEPYMETY